MAEKGTFWALLTIIIGCYYLSTWGPQLGSIVETNQGSIQGIIFRSRDGREFHQWLKIPYAQPPIGNLRFANPQPVQKWEGVKDGSSYGAKCPQLNFHLDRVDGNEDCLFLNIHAPKLNDTNELLPVLVFLHGGSFTFGSGYDLDPDYFMDQDLIVVTLNYRLSLLGFISTGDETVGGNMGLKDQIEALKWLKENVGHFGGDPNKISILGESAGSAVVHYLTLFETGRAGLFKKSISMSGTAFAPGTFDSPERSTAKTKQFASDLNCTTTDTLLMVECLRALEVTELFAVYRKDGLNLTVMNPSKDGLQFLPAMELLVTETLDSVSQGEVHIPRMTGLNKDEGLATSLVFYTDDEALDFVETNWEESLQNLFTFPGSPEQVKEISNKLRQFYFKNEMTREEKILAYTKMYTDGLHFWPLSETAKLERQVSPIYLYFYNKTGGMAGLAGVKTNRQHLIVELIHFLLNLIWDGAVQVIEYLDLIDLQKRRPPDYEQDLSMFYPLLSYLSITNEEDPVNKLSKDVVKLFHSFVSSDETTLEFRGTKFNPNEKEGPLMYLEINEESQMISEPFNHEMEFWRSLSYTFI